jgi:hypothetical protein
LFAGLTALLTIVPAKLGKVVTKGSNAPSRAQLADLKRRLLHQCRFRRLFKGLNLDSLVFIVGLPSFSIGLTLWIYWVYFAAHGIYWLQRKRRRFVAGIFRKSAAL